MKLMEMLDNLEELRIDNVDGWGAVPYNQNVDYRGLRVKIKPSVFLKLAHELSDYPSASDIEQHIKADGSIGAPFLIIKIPHDWFKGNFIDQAEVQGHEGRNRMAAVKKVEGDIPVETHLFFTGEVRNRDLTPVIIKQLNKRIFSQSDQLVTGPWFTEFKAELSEDENTHVTRILQKAQTMIDKGQVYAALVILDDSNISASNSQMRTMIKQNTMKIAEFILKGLTDSEQINSAARLIHTLKSNWFLMDNLDVLPNENIYTFLNQHKQEIIDSLSSKITDHLSFGQIGAVLDELEHYWGLDIGLNDVFDLNKNKVFVLKSLMSLRKEDKEFYIIRLIRLLVRSGITWPELSVIHKKLVESDENSNLPDIVRHYFETNRVYDAVVAVADVGENINYYRQLYALFDKNTDKIAQFVLLNITEPNVLRHCRELLDSIGFGIPNHSVELHLQKNDTKIIQPISSLFLENFPETHDLLDELREWGINIRLEQLIDLEKNKRAVLKLVLSLIKDKHIRDAKYLISMIDLDWPELDIIEDQLYAKYPPVIKETTSTEQGRLRTVKTNPYLIHRIDNPSEAVQLAAVTKNGQVIKDIIEKGIVPSVDVQLAAINNWAFAVNYILAKKIPVQPEVKRLVLRLLIDFCKIGGEPVVAMSLYDLLIKYKVNWPELETIRKYLNHT